MFAIFNCQGRRLSILALGWMLTGDATLLPCPAEDAPRNPAPTRTQPNEKPNIIFVLADDLGYGDLGCYGQSKIKTPNLDRLAAEGMRFTQFYAGSGVSAPSRAALMTGQHTGHAFIRGDRALALRAQDLTIAELLQPAGYKTGAVGKWGLGLPGSTGTPNRKGFGDWVGYLGPIDAEDAYPTQLYRNEALIILDKNLYGNKGQYAPDFFSMVASNFVRVNKYFPFFLQIGYTIPRPLNVRKDPGTVVPPDGPYANESWPQPEKNKAAMITRLDADIGALMAHLKKLKIDDRTVIFFSSDNGPHREGGVNPDFFQSAGPLRGLKGDLYEGGIRVPMIVRWPGHIKPGSVSDQVWAFWDFLPTAAEIASVKPPGGGDGISVLPTLLGRTQTNQHDIFYWEIHEHGSKQAVRMGDWKALRLEPGSPLELYNLKLDPAETRNVASGHPDIIALMEGRLKTARTESTEWPLRAAETSEPDRSADRK